MEGLCFSRLLPWCLDSWGCLWSTWTNDHHMGFTKESLKMLFLFLWWKEISCHQFPHSSCCGCAHCIWNHYSYLVTMNERFREPQTKLELLNFCLSIAKFLPTLNPALYLFPTAWNSSSVSWKSLLFFIQVWAHFLKHPCWPLSIKWKLPDSWLHAVCMCACVYTCAPPVMYPF